MTSVRTRRFSSTINLGFFSIRPGNPFWKAPPNSAKICLAVPHRGSWLAAGFIGSIGNRLVRHSRIPAEAMKELAGDISTLGLHVARFSQSEKSITIRNRASFLIILAYASAACSSGTRSIIGRTACNALKSNVSSSSIEVPTTSP